MLTKPDDNLGIEFEVQVKADPDALALVNYDSQVEDQVEDIALAFGAPRLEATFLPKPQRMGVLEVDHISTGPRRHSSPIKVKRCRQASNHKQRCRRQDPIG